MPGGGKKAMSHHDPVSFEKKLLEIAYNKEACYIYIML